jgi:hypothetical protein
VGLLKDVLGAALGGLGGAGALAAQAALGRKKRHNAGDEPYEDESTPGSDDTGGGAGRVLKRTAGNLGRAWSRSGKGSGR